jgi:fucose permease
VSTISDRGLISVSTLDFLWGFANGLVGGLSAQIQTLLGSSPSHTIALNNIFYCAYFVGPLLVGYWVLNLAGFKATFITGLAIYAVGALAFWPSSVLLSYAGFVVSNFMLALGLSCLELAANLFIILAGPSELSEARFNFAQGFFGVGIIVSPIVAEKALFSSINQEDLFRVQWCYLAVGLFAVLLALIFYYCPLSEASDDEIEEIAEVRLYNAGLTQSSKAFSLGARRLLLWSGALVLFFSQGTEAVNYSWTPIVQYVKPGSNSFWDLIIARCVLTFGRFLAAWLCFVGIPPRVILCLSLLGAFLTSLLAFVIPPGSAALMLLILYLLFQAPIYPTLFAMIMRGQGRHTKFAATIAVMSIPGGAVWPSVVYGIQLRYPTTPLWPLLLVAILHGISMTWPVVVSTNWVLRRWVDPKWSKTAATQSDDQEDSSRSGHQSGFAPQPNAVPELLTRGTARHRDGVDGSEYTEAQA